MSSQYVVHFKRQIIKQKIFNFYIWIFCIYGNIGLIYLNMLIVLIAHIFALASYVF